MTDSLILENFTQAVEERHNSEEKETITVNQTSDQAKRYQDAFVDDEESENYEDHPEYEQGHGRTLRL